MSLREILLVLLLLIGLGLIVSGVAVFSVGAARIVAGLGVIALAWLTLTEVS